MSLYSVFRPRVGSRNITGLLTLDHCNADVALHWIDSYRRDRKQTVVIDVRHR